MARCLETIYACIWRMFVFLSVVWIVWGSVGMFIVLRPLLKMMFFSLEVLNYVVCCVAGVMDVAFSVCIVRRGAVGAHVWEE